MATTPEDDLVTVFGKVLDPTVCGMTINDVRIVLEDCLEGLETDSERIDSVVLMFTTLSMSAPTPPPSEVKCTVCGRGRRIDMTDPSGVCTHCRRKGLG